MFRISGSVSIRLGELLLDGSAAVCDGRGAIVAVFSVRSTAVRVVPSSTSLRSSSTARSSRLRSSVSM
jgi:hypothetical protein